MNIAFHAVHARSVLLCITIFFLLNRRENNFFIKKIKIRITTSCNYRYFEIFLEFLSSFRFSSLFLSVEKFLVSRKSNVFNN